ncbi:MAG: hypothetical protein ABJA62_10090 [Luteimonas sp.]
MTRESVRSSPSLRRPQCKRAALAAATLAIAFVGNAACADAYLNTIGGGGGGQFKAHCPGNELLAGFELRTGDDVDAIRPLCVIVYGPHRVSAIPFTNGNGFIVHIVDANREVLGNYSPAEGDWIEPESGWNGGLGGGITNIVCPGDKPIVTGMFVAAEGVDTVIVNNIHLFCGEATTTQVASDFPAAVFDAPAYKASDAVLGIGSGGSQPYRDNNTQHCPGGQVAVGVHGRSGKWLDAIGLICGAPPPPGKSIGRVDTGKPPPEHPAGWTICDAARDARGRNSPAAPNLEAQCAARTPVKSIGRVKTNTPAPPHPPGWTICDAARSARARNSPAAPNLEAQCRAAGSPPPAAAPPAAPPAQAPAPPPPPPPEPAPEPAPDPAPDPVPNDGG